MSVSLFEHPVLAAHFGDEAIAAHFRIEAEISTMLTFEMALAEAEAHEGLIAPEAAVAIVKACETFEPDFSALREGAARDGLIVPELIRELRKTVPAPHADHLHFGATSQDVIDTSLVLRLKMVIPMLTARLENLIASLQDLDERFSDNELVGRTRMQAAMPIPVGARLRAWLLPISRALDELEDVGPELLQLQFGGGAGTLDKLGENATGVAMRLGFLLDLEVPRSNWHSQRDGVARFANWLSLVTGALGKIGQDIALMAQNEIGEIAMTGGGGSSAMPHKQNPVRAETLVALARFNATQLSGMHQALIHEQERSGAAWALEWMILPQMVVATGAATRLAIELLDSVESIGVTQ
ncbi:3-carboxy-cis,cis-muconate cycloisomerase [Pararhizobium haloflavum]|uniref:3-carboxy-cis,cis-muconate cycloisomerase n=1 Tax=Pararhizobium haloflavum TaxID=2037914 RepID=UPI000C18B2D1|nr:3-carboxy-cis,cis-muconate cycloisomerase [Pararhizobium haloflavum]